LYRSGDFYDVTVDLYEKNPLDIENLKKALELYKDKRPPLNL
jgi:hypothetical protein